MFTLSACQNTPTVDIPTVELPQPAIVITSPTASPTIALTPTQTATPAPTAIPHHPLSIDYIRSVEYEASEIVIEEVLEPGVNYFRYLASYQSEGFKNYALLTVPYGDTPETGWPVIVFNHGYIPPEQYRTTERYIAYVDNLARQGYIVFRPDYRGHGNSEGLARGAYGRPDYVIDVLNAVASMKAYEDADPNRIGMWGHSMGGYITIRAMVAFQDIKAGVIWAGVVASYEEMYNHPQRPRFGSRGIASLYGAPEEDPDFWAAISANSYLEDLSGPIQLHHGTKDTTVPYSYSVSLAEEVRAVGGTAQLYLHKSDDHNIANNFGGAMLNTIRFFEKYLKNLEEPPVTN